MKVLGLSGSLRAGSHNSKLLRAAADLLPPEAELVEFDGLKAIPPFDEDDEHTRPDAVQALFDAIAERRRGPASPPRSTTTRSRASSRTRSTGSRARWPTARCATSRPPSSAPPPACSARSGPRPRPARCSSAIGARVIDRELPVGLADDAFTPDGSLADDDLSLALAGILAELAARGPPARLAASKGDSPL